MSFILKTNLKLHFFEVLPFNEVFVGLFVMIKSWSETFITTYVLFAAFSTWKNKIHYILRTTAQVIMLDAIFSLSNERFKLLFSQNKFALFTPCAFSVTDFLALLDTFLALLIILIMSIFSKAFSCSLPDGGSNCISDLRQCTSKFRKHRMIYGITFKITFICYTLSFV